MLVQDSVPFDKTSRFEGGGASVEHAILLAMGWTPDAVQNVAMKAAASRTGLVRTAIALGLIKPAEFYPRLSRILAFTGDDGIDYRIISPKAPRNAWMLLDDPVAVLVHPGNAAINAEAAPIEMLADLAERLGDHRRRLTLLTRQSVIHALTRSFGDVLVKRAVYSLHIQKPELSAKSGPVLWQAVLASTMTGLFLGACLVSPRETILCTSVILSIIFFLAVMLRLAAAVNLMLPSRVTNPAPPLKDVDLPAYTILVPLYREAAILPYLAHALSAMDYPAAKLDIKIILEAVDHDTIAAAVTMDLPGNVDIIVVPDCQPRTKPKALNYALQFATGDLAVIYDAEDRPDPDQLRKAAAAFYYGDRNLVCLQARLNYFNAKENWLSRQFTIEYAALFRGLLPFLSRFKLPMPLGGTSNHFRISALRELGAWDPFNVTEDADLGLRLHRAGYRAATLDSTTYEEACCQCGPWIRQRTRWLKGWMQTFGVHTRSPAKTLRQTGVAGFVAFHGYFAGIIVSALVYPFFYVLILHQYITGSVFSPSDTIENAMMWLAIVNFILGYIANAALAILSLRDRSLTHLIRHVVFIPLYWLLISLAVYRAVWQLFTRPFYWEKTAHGVSKYLNQV